MPYTPSHTVPSKHPSNPILHAEKHTPSELLTSNTALSGALKQSAAYKRFFFCPCCNTDLCHKSANSSRQLTLGIFYEMVPIPVCSQRSVTHPEKHA